MLHIYKQADIDTYISRRKGETKFGEKVQLLSSSENLQEQLLQSNVKYVLLGIPEDIGIRANRGKAGATTAWKATLKALLNTQANAYNKAKKVLVLGHFDFTESIEIAANLDVSLPNYHSQLAELTKTIDSEVSHVVYQIVSAGKKPIIIGGGHNNAYGNIKGTALGKSNAINVINFDAHTDFRALEGRHSGNGFRYAFEEYFLDKYFMFGLHENYTSKKVFKKIAMHPERIQYTTFEEIEIRKEKGFSFELYHALDFINNRTFGVEMDCDSIENVPSSAMTSTGFTANQAREFASFFGRQKKAAYLHICEAAPNAQDEREMYLVGKLLSSLITDFIRG